MAVPFATAAILNSSVDNDKDGVKAVPAGFAITLPHCLNPDSYVHCIHVIDIKTIHTLKCYIICAIAYAYSCVLTGHMYGNDRPCIFCKRYCVRCGISRRICLKGSPLFTISKEGEDSAKNIDIINYFCKSENIVLKLFVVVLLL